jgi:hypothetical protein
MAKTRGRKARTVSAAQAARQSLVAAEFAAVDLGDTRREQRVQSIAAAVAAKPATSFPRALASEADLEGFYRLVRNEAVSFDDLLQPHVAATVGRMTGGGAALAVHDTTDFVFGGTRKGLGRVNHSGQGFLGHFSLAVSAEGSRTPLGVLAVEPWARQEPTKTALLQQRKVSFAVSRELPSEQDRWWRGIEAAEAVAAGAVSLVHVMDSEADDYALMTQLVGAHRRWIIRLCYDRKLAEVEPGQPRKAKALVASREVKCTRKVHVARRRRAPGGNANRRRVRTARTATLAISATPALFRRPNYCTDSPPTLAVNIVAVREVEPPPDHEPVEWLLVTTEPIDTDEQILRVVDYYRGRWVIEEYFKALKTGCAYEQRQLESWHTLLNTLGVLIPVAWSLLNLRTIARQHEAAPARLVVTELQEKVLRAAVKERGQLLPVAPTASAVLLAVARLGGHLRSNGDPGWLVLGRGYQDLLMMTAGYRLAMGEK